MKSRFYFIGDIFLLYYAIYILHNNKARLSADYYGNKLFQISAHLRVDLDKSYESLPSPPRNRRRPPGSSFRRRAPHARAILIAILSRLTPRTFAKLMQLSPSLSLSLASRPGRMTRDNKRIEGDRKAISLEII